MWSQTTHVFDRDSGLPFNQCSSGRITAAFKRVGGVIYARIMYAFGGQDSGWVTPMAQIYTSQWTQAKQYSGNIWGIYLALAGVWECFANVT